MGQNLSLSEFSAEPATIRLSRLGHWVAHSLSLVRIAAVLTLGLLPTMSRSADVVIGGDGDMGCRITVSGQIVSGDTERLASALESVFGEMLVCFDSPGGSWVEGLKLMEFLYEEGLPAGVGPSARCESACAVAFLGGSKRTFELEPVRSRYLHVDGRLGFHAPYLDEIPARNYTEVDVRNVFRIGMGAASQLTAWSDRLELSADLLSQMFDTGPEDLLLIDTVGGALELDISLVGVRVPPSLSSDMIKRACAAHSELFREGTIHIEASTEIVQVFDLGRDDPKMVHGLAIARLWQESFREWFACEARYRPVPTPTRTPSSDVLVSERTGVSVFPDRVLILAHVTERPIMEANDGDGGDAAPDRAELQLAVDLLSRAQPRGWAVPFETVLPPGIQIARLASPDWFRESPAASLMSSGPNPAQLAGAVRQPDLRPVRPLPSNSCYIVAASRATLAEAIEFASRQLRGRNVVSIFMSENGWFAVTLGSATTANSQARISQLKAQGVLPSDAYCGGGSRFQYEVR